MPGSGKMITSNTLAHGGPKSTPDKGQKVVLTCNLKCSMINGVLRCILSLLSGHVECMKDIKLM